MMIARWTTTWNRFWFDESNTLALGLFRILFAVCLWREIGTTASRSRFAIEGGFHLPYFSFPGLGVRFCRNAWPEIR